MPTKEQLALFKAMDGGTGDAKEDSKLVRKLGQIADVPQDQLKAFVKTRDKPTLDCLQRVLEELPRPHTVGGSGKLRGDTPSTPMTRASTAPSGSLSSGSTASGSQARLRQICGMTSSYRNQFGTPTKVPDSALGSLKDGFRKSSGFHEWSASAPTDQVKALVETCRSMRYFGKKGGNPTTYEAEFKEFEDTSGIRSKLPEGDMRKSSVPIGSVGKTSKSEEAAFQGRQAFHETCVEEARRREQRHLNGVSLQPEGKLEFAGSFSQLLDVAEACQKVGEEQGVPAKSRDWKALARASWTSGVHTQVQTQRHGHYCTKQGEERHKELRRAKTFSNTCAAHTEHYGKIVSKKDPVFCVRNPKDPSGQKYSRFTYAKHSGYIP